VQQLDLILICLALVVTIQLKARELVFNWISMCGHFIDTQYDYNNTEFNVVTANGTGATT